MEEFLRNFIKGIVEDVVRDLVKKTNTELLTPDQLADRLKVSVTWIYEQSRLNNIPTHRIGRYIRFNLQEVIDSQKKAGDE